MSAPRTLLGLCLALTVPSAGGCARCGGADSEPSSAQADPAAPDSSEAPPEGDPSGPGASELGPPDPGLPDPGPPDPGASAGYDPGALLAVDIEGTDFASNPDLLVRLRSGPHAYFRFIHQPFSTAVCHELGDAMLDAPPVNLHGDAHLEQYAVTDLGRGLTDFDGASAGPGMLDLARLGVSLRLASEAHGWEDAYSGLLDRLLEGYVEGLDAEEDTPLPDEPAAVRRVREDFEANPRQLTATVDDMMLPITDVEEAELRAAMGPYVQVQLEQEESLDAAFFDIVRMGRLDLGIGSALDKKYLYRVRGPSDAPEDDVVLEAKEVLSLAGIPCIQASPEPDPFRILLGQARIAYRPFPYLGYIQAMGHVFWMHGWTNRYHEMSVTDSYESAEELRELVYDVGVQLGRGHVNSIAAPLDVQLRRSQARFVETHGEHLREAIDRLTEHTRDAYRDFVARTDEHPALARAAQLVEAP